jgi:hypothetical protein
VELAGVVYRSHAVHLANERRPVLQFWREEALAESGAGNPQQPRRFKTR